MERERPFVFIGSSTEGLRVAEALQELLERVCEVQLWTQGVFGLGEATLESLTRCCREADFAVLILTNDDFVISREQQAFTPRDNVVFELGLFMGALGRERTFFVYDRIAVPKIPTDLAGITAAEYTPPVFGDLPSALGAAASRIKRAVERLGSRSEVEPLRTVSGCEMSVGFGRIEEGVTPEGNGVVVLPANEFFDDECILDRRSALGAFVQTHFKEKAESFQSVIKAELKKYEPRLVEKEPGIYAPSYGVGTVVFLERSALSKFNVAPVAVTTKRAGEGLRASPSFILDAIASIGRLVADKRLASVHLPLLGAGHGGIPPAVSLQCILIGLSELAWTPAGHHLKRCHITVFQKGPEWPPELSEEVVQQILHGGKVWLGPTIAGF
jgi:hypothetical protein